MRPLVHDRGVSCMGAKFAGIVFLVRRAETLVWPEDLRATSADEEGNREVLRAST